MDLINPWLDPSEVRHLAEQLLRPTAPARVASVDLGFDTSFIGFTSGDLTAAIPNPPESPLVSWQQPIPLKPPVPTLPQVTQSLENLTSSAPSLPAASPSQPPSEPSPSLPSRTRYPERLSIFRDWFAKEFQAAEIFILDREGKVIFDESGHGRFHFMARNLVTASHVSGNIRVKIGPAAILEVIPCETPNGRLVLGALLPNALSAYHIHTISEALIQTASAA